uniref:Uncharacterized protein n=1 Tax=Arundo donax TaxID=35708 RepID=A0A0A9FPE5_ARUDO
MAVLTAETSWTCISKYTCSIQKIKLVHQMTKWYLHSYLLVSVSTRSLKANFFSLNHADITCQCMRFPFCSRKGIFTSE